MPRMHVRAATPRDEDAIVAHSLALADESEGRAPDPEALRRGVRLALAEPWRARYFVAEEADAAVGVLFVTAEWSDWTGGWYWWLQGVRVDPQHRRKGVYRALVDAVRQAAREQGDVRCLRLYVHGGNDAGARAHEAVGFAPTAYQILEAPVERDEATH